MKIENLRLEKNNNMTAARASVTWEDNDRPRQELFFETKAVYEDSLSCNPIAFLLACAIPALHFKEQRIFMEEEVCPELVDGLITVMHWLRHWYYEPERKIVTIEAQNKAKSKLGYPQKSRFFLLWRRGLFCYTKIESTQLSGKSSMVNQRRSWLPMALNLKI